MKKFIRISTVLCALTALLSIMSFATSYSYSNTDFSYSWTKTQLSGDARLTYNAKTGLFSEDVNSQTGIFLTVSQYGYVASTTTAVNNTSKHEYKSGQSGGGWLTSPKAYVSGQGYAKKVVFYADRRSAPNTIIGDWQWTYQ